MSLSAKANTFDPYSLQAVQPVRQPGWNEDLVWYEPNVPSNYITSVRFDPYEELMWSGTSDGRVVSYSLPGATKYTSWFAHEVSQNYDTDCSISEILVNQEGVVSLSSTGVKYCTRGGLPKSYYLHDENEQLYATCFVEERTGARSKIVFGGSGDSLYVFDLERSKVCQELQLPNGITRLKQGRFLYCGTPSGKITVCDQRSNRIENTFLGCTGPVTDLAEKGDLLVACGFGTRMGQTIVDQIIKVYDIRTMRPLQGFPFHAGPYRMEFHPKFSSMLLVASSSGEFTIVDATTGFGHLPMYSIDTQGLGLSCFDISSSGSIIGLGDINGALHQWGESEDVTVNNYSYNALPIVDPFPTPSCEMTETCPLNTPQMDLLFEHCQSELLSTWNGCPYFAVPYPPKQIIPPEVARNMRRQDFLSVCPVPPGNHIRNLILHCEPAALPTYLDCAEFFESTEDTKKKGDKDMEPETETEETEVESEGEKYQSRPPKQYRVLRLRHSPKSYLYNISRYNQTRLSGLENALKNTYINSLLQTLYWIPQIHAFCQSILYREELTITDELGFLFRTMDLASGTPCEPRNFLTTLQKMPTAQNIGIFEEDVTETSYPKLIEKVQAYLLDRIHKECTTLNPVNKNTKWPQAKEIKKKTNNSIIDDVFGSTMKTVNNCMHCKNATQISTRHLSYNLSFPSTPSSFATVLRNSLSTASNTHAWCENCGSFQMSHQRKEVTTLPNILVLNCPSSQMSEDFWESVSDDASALWADGNRNNMIDNADSRPHWIPFTIQLSHDSKTEKMQVKEFSSNKSVTSTSEGTVYVLTSVISCVTDWASVPNRHLVSQIRVKPSGHPMTKDDKSQDPGWYLFNDYQVLPISQFEAVHVDHKWKVPCILYYTQLNSTSLKPIPPITNPVGDFSLFHERPLSKPSTDLSFKPLTIDEIPKPGTLVAIDTEYVRTSEEVLRNQGQRRVVIRPMQFSLARVSVLRSWDNFEPFIDDYISIDESTIQDYLTQYSGVHSGDLDPTRSKHYVTTLKQACLKLRYLADQGTIFVGHGLQSDFTIISILSHHVLFCSVMFCSVLFYSNLSRYSSAFVWIKKR
eukprot:TRINITY_DN802_c0_g2_i5.p1 TRINITY_DN802_c0_g2~~TRINITY_DN802_c0_g2_i5.p1  ORF type:complete len:1089 (-),score=127.13 TRINITY_DN802_c0_g2_i5:162-3428(-)